MKKLSIVIAVYNGEDTLQVALDSIREQKTEDVEVLVIDGNSRDKTMEIVGRNDDLIDIAISEPDNGIYDAWNKAIVLSNALFVSFLGADDRLAPGALSVLRQAISHAQLDVNLIAGFNVMTRGGVPSYLITSQYSLTALAWKMPLAQLMSAHRVDWLRLGGGFDATYRTSGDYELIIRHRQRLKVQILPAILAFMEAGGTSGTGIRPCLEDYRAKTSNGMSRFWSTAVFLKALIGYGLRVVGLRRGH